MARARVAGTVGRAASLGRHVPMLPWARAALVLTILVFVPHLLEFYEAPKVVVLQALGLGALGAAFAVLRGARGSEAPRAQLLDLAVLLWLLVDGVATATSQAPRISFFGDFNQHEGLLTSLSLAGIYVSARLGTRGAADVEGTLACVVVATMLASGYALIQVLGLDPLPWKGMDVRAGGWYMRPFATLDHPNVLGVITASGFAIATGMAVAGARRRLWLVAAVVLGLTTVLTLSRGAWLGGVAGSAVTLALALRARRKDKAWSRALALALLATGVVLVILFATLDVFRGRVLELLSPATGSSRARLEIWRSALAMWRAHPWTGVGLDLFGLYFPRYQTPEFWRFEWGLIHYHAHSIYLHVLATRGLLGAAAGLLGLIALIQAVGAASKTHPEREHVAPMVGSLAALAVAGAFGVLATAGGTLLVAMLGSIAGLAASAAANSPAANAAVAQPAPQGSQDPKKRRAARRASGARGARDLPWPGLVVAGLVLVLSVRGLAASWAGFYAREHMPRAAEDLGDPRSAAMADRAAGDAPSDDRIANLRANVYLAYASVAQRIVDRPVAQGTISGWLAEAERSARSAVALVPRRAANQQTLGNVLLARARQGDAGSLAEAQKAYRACWELAPYDAFALDRFADETMRLGRSDQALEPARRAVSLYPDEAMTEQVLGRVWLALGDTTAGAQAYRRALAGHWHVDPRDREETVRYLNAFLARFGRAPEAAPTR